MRNCDCDECDFIPVQIAVAIRQHKRLKTHALTRTQDRTLVARADTISVWKLTMPVDAEPLIEFGNSHRIVLVDSLSSVRSLLATNTLDAASATTLRPAHKLYEGSHIPCVCFSSEIVSYLLGKVSLDRVMKQRVVKKWIGSKARLVSFPRTAAKHWVGYTPKMMPRENR